MCDRALHLEKQQENSLVWTAQSKMLVDSMLDDVYAVLQPTKEQQEARRYVIHFVDNFVKSRIQGEFLFYLCSISLHLGFRWDGFLLCFGEEWKLVWTKNEERKEELSMLPWHWTSYLLSILSVSLGKNVCSNIYLYCAGSHITVFGSFVMDLYTGSSDLDLSLNVGYAPVERSRSDRIGFLRKLTRALHGLQNGPHSAPSICFTAS